MKGVRRHNLVTERDKGQIWVENGRDHVFGSGNGPKNGT